MDRHELKRGQFTVTGGSILQENYMTGLLAAQNISLLEHHFENVTVADIRALDLHAVLFSISVQAHVRQDGRNKSAAAQLALLFHVCCAYRHDAVTVQLFAGFIDDQTAVGITVKCRHRGRSCRGGRAP